MATRFYLPASGTAPASPAFGSLWDLTTSATRCPLVTTPTNTALVMVSTDAETSTTNAIDGLIRQYVSDVLPAGSISGTFSYVIGSVESANGANAFNQIRISVVSGDGSVERGVLYAGQTDTVPGGADTPNQEFSTAGHLTRFISGAALSSVTAQSGDRIVVEIGARFANTSATSYTAELHIGDPTAGGDHALSSGVNTSLRPWVEFSQNVFSSGPTMSLAGTLQRETADFTLDAGPFVTLGGTTQRETGSFTLDVEADPSLTLGGTLQREEGAFVLDAGRTITLAGEVQRETGAFEVTTGHTLTLGGTLQRETGAFVLATPNSMSLAGTLRRETAVVMLDAGRLISLNGTLQRVTGALSFGVVPTMQRRNRLGGRRRSLIATATYEPPVEAMPANLPQGQMMEVANAFSAVTLNGTEPVYTVTSARATRLRTRIVVGGKDVTYFRGVPTPEPQYQLIEPLSYGVATLTFPQIVAWAERPGVNPLRWLRKGAKVLIQRVSEDDEVVATDYRGVVIGYDLSGRSLTVQVGGELSGRAALRWEPKRLFRTTSDAGTLAYFAVRHYGLRFLPRGGPTTGIQLQNFGDMGGLDYLLNLCAMAQDTSGNQWTIERWANVWRMVRKDTTTIRASLYVDDERVRADLRRDFAEEPNRVFADGVTKEGERVRFGIYPGLRQGDAAPYPFDDERTFAIGTTDEDTDTGDGITVMIARLIVCGYLTWRDSAGDYDADVVRGINRLQEEAGLGATGQMDPPTWEVLFDLTQTGYSLNGIRVMPAAQRSRVRRWDRSGSGSIIRRNPDYDPHELVVDTAVSVGAGKERGQIREWSRTEIGVDPWAGLTETSNWVGTITLGGASNGGSGVTYALIDGEHNPGDPLTEADVLPARALRPGDNIWLPLLDGGTLAHVSAVNVDNGRVQIDVDTRARDAMKVWQVIARNRESRRNPAREFLASYRSSAIPKDIVEFEEYGGTVDAQVRLTGGTWNVFPVIAGEAGTIARTRVTTTPATEFAMAVFGKRISKARLNNLLAAPLSEGAGWEDAQTRRVLEDHVMLYASGDWEQPLGYFPARKTDEEGATFALVTGRHEDDASYGYRTFEHPVLWVAIWVPTDCAIPPGRILWNQQEAGS